MEVSWGSWKKRAAGQRAFMSCSRPLSSAASAPAGALIATGRRAAPVGLRIKRDGGNATGGRVAEEQGLPSHGKSLAKLRAHEETDRVGTVGQEV